jgi:hypothetical protein
MIQIQFIIPKCTHNHLTYLTLLAHILPLQRVESRIVYKYTLCVSLT